MSQSLNSACYELGFDAPLCSQSLHKRLSHVRQTALSSRRLASSGSPGQQQWTDSAGKPLFGRQYLRWRPLPLKIWFTNSGGGIVVMPCGAFSMKRRAGRIRPHTHASAPPFRYSVTLVSDRPCDTEPVDQCVKTGFAGQIFVDLTGCFVHLCKSNGPPIR